jgi:hypothetical protein
MDWYIVIKVLNSTVSRSRLRLARPEVTFFEMCWTCAVQSEVRSRDSTNSKLAKLQNINLLINNSPLNRVESFKYLGITVNQTLSWSDHIEELFTKVIQRLGIIRRVKRLLTVESRGTL